MGGSGSGVVGGKTCELAAVGIPGIPKISYIGQGPAYHLVWTSVYPFLAVIFRSCSVQPGWINFCGNLSEVTSVCEVPALYIYIYINGLLYNPSYSIAG